MDVMERPELLPACDVPARLREPDDRVREWLVHFGDEARGDSRRIGGVRACALRGGPALAAAAFMIGTPGLWAEGIRRIARIAGVHVDRPPYTASESLVGICYVAGTKGLPSGLRHRAADALVTQAQEAGYAEARHLLPRNGWDWLADAVRSGWALWTATRFSEDETAPVATRMRVGLALAEHDWPGSFVPEALGVLVAHPRARSTDRLSLALAVSLRAPSEAQDLLCRLASDPLVQPGHRMQALGRLDEVNPARAQEMRALQTRLPSARAARDDHREATERAEREAAARRELEAPGAVLERLDSEIELILADLRERGSAEWLADGLDDHLAESDWHGVEEDVAVMCGVARDGGVESAIRALDLLTRIRHGDGTLLPEDSPGPGAPNGDDFPRLTQQDLDDSARRQAERSWVVWKGLVEQYGWDEDRLEELGLQVANVNQIVREWLCQETADHLRRLREHLVWELWPDLASAAEERDYAAALAHLASARRLADEAEQAETLWKEATAMAYAFDPLTLSWPREFWLVFEEWRRNAGPAS
ncbi:hypothetical protein [Streptomyces sp. NPDC048603]|uniref:hypothetical protein n=1 Tax=Streptomyces sp. NPDC048603 TaxID=3365577 RepID=UPI003712BB15